MEWIGERNPPSVPMCADLLEMELVTASIKVLSMNGGHGEGRVQGPEHSLTDLRGGDW